VSLPETPVTADGDGIYWDRVWLRRDDAARLRDHFREVAADDPRDWFAPTLLLYANALDEALKQTEQEPE